MGFFASSFLVDRNLYKLHLRVPNEKDLALSEVVLAMDSRSMESCMSDPGSWPRDNFLGDHDTQEPGPCHVMRAGFGSCNVEPHWARWMVSVAVMCSWAALSARTDGGDDNLLFFLLCNSKLKEWLYLFIAGSISIWLRKEISTLEAKSMRF